MFGFKLFWIVFVDIGIIENDIIAFYQHKILKRCIMAKFEIAKSRINCKKKKPERFISLSGFLK